MEALSFLAGVVTEGVRTIGSRVTRAPEGEGERFNSLLAQALGGESGKGGSTGAAAADSATTTEEGADGESADAGTGSEDGFGPSSGGGDPTSIIARAAMRAAISTGRVDASASVAALAEAGPAGSGAEATGTASFGATAAGSASPTAGDVTPLSGDAATASFASDSESVDRIGGATPFAPSTSTADVSPLAPVSGVVEPSASLAADEASLEDTDPVAGVGPRAPNASASRDPLLADRDLDRLDPELRTRLERVVERMGEEFGHRVEVVEGYRTPERQDWLFAQGRERPGDVVTWTRNSHHMSGQAVDVRIDGGWDDRTAFARLQRIAQEEGLGTLGMRDPGHLELPGASGDHTHRALDSHRGLDLSSRHAALDGEAEPDTDAFRRRGAIGADGVARVARVASVAQVARVGTPGMAAPTAGMPAGLAPNGSTIPAAPDAIAAPPAPTFEGEPASTLLDGSRMASAEVTGTRATLGAAAARPAATQTATAQSGNATVAAAATDESARSGDASDAEAESDGEGRGSDGRRATEASGTSKSAEPARFSLGNAPGGVRGDGAVSPTAAARASTTVQRLEQIMALQDARAAAGSDGLRLTMPNADGDGTRLRVDLRGSSVGAQVDLSDPVAAQRMRTNIAELHRALEARGLEGDEFLFRGGGTEFLEAVTAASRSGATQNPADFVRQLMADLTGQSDSRDARRTFDDSDPRSSGRNRKDANHDGTEQQR